MKPSDIILHRLKNQQIADCKFDDPGELVAWFGAVQSQDYAAAKWALGLRLQNATDHSIDEAFNSGKILRTHLMRPTWHFVAPEDIRWLLELTAPRVNAFNAYMYRKLELDERIFRRSNKLIAKALEGGRQLTRTELEDVHNKAGIATPDIRMICLMMRAELDGLICSGPRKGKQFTYMLLEERAPRAKRLNKDEALGTLAKRYFISHGPATLPDFAWWSGLTATDAKAGLEMVKSALVHGDIGGKVYWFSSSANTPKNRSHAAHLLPNFDEYSVAYTDRDLLFDAAKAKVTPPPNFILGNTIIANGRIVGTWKRTFKKNTAEIVTDLFTDTSKASEKAIDNAIKRYGTFIGMPAKAIRK